MDHDCDRECPRGVSNPRAHLRSFGELHHVDVDLDLDLDLDVADGTGG
jgi:hypothetical protein